MLGTTVSRDPRFATDQYAMSRVSYADVVAAMDDDSSSGGDVVLEQGVAPPLSVVISPNLIAAIPEFAALIGDARRFHLQELPLHTRANAVPADIEAAAAAAMRREPDALERLQALALQRGRAAIVADRDYIHFCTTQARPAFNAALADVAPIVRAALGRRMLLATTTMTMAPATGAGACGLGLNCTTPATTTVTVTTAFEPPLHVGACDACARIADTLRYASAPADALCRGEAANLRFARPAAPAPPPLSSLVPSLTANAVR